MSPQFVLLGLYVVLDVVLELLPSQLDAAGQGVQLLFCEAWDLGQARVGVQKHGLLKCVSLLIGRMIPLWACAGAGFCGLQVVIYGGKRYLAAPEQRQLSHSWRAVICSMLRLSDCPSRTWYRGVTHSEAGGRLAGVEVTGQLYCGFRSALYQSQSHRAN